MTTKKLSKIFLGLIVAAGMILSSCTKDVNVGGTDVDESSAGSGYFALKVRTSTGTKAYVVETGEPEEGQVNAIRVVLYNPSTNVVAYSWDFNTTETPTPDSLYLYKQLGSQYVTIAQKVEKREYNLLVMINPTADAKTATEKGMPYSAYTAVQTLTPEDLTESDPGVKDNFMMSNFAGLVGIKVGNIHEEKGDAHAAPVAVNVERAVAKIMVIDNRPVNRSNVYYDLIGWAADITNQKTFWTRKQAPMADGSIETGDPLDREEMYAIDPNYQGYSLAYTPAYLAANEFNYIAAADIPEYNIGGWQYVLENTMVKDEQYTDVTTRVILKALYYPRSSSIDDVAIADGDPYYVYKNAFVFSTDQIQDIFADTYEGGWANIEAANPSLAGFQAFLQTNSSEFNDYSSLTESIKFEDLQFNYDGVNYYSILIRHFSDEIQPELMAYGRYGVVRNNVYKVNINGITGPGSVVIPGGPEDLYPEDPTPDDGEQGFVSVDIEILEWFVRTQGVDL